MIYDRRGFSQSHLDGPQDDAQRLQTDADDVRRLIEHLTDQPAIVFGNSSGAIVALNLLLSSGVEELALVVWSVSFSPIETVASGETKTVDYTFPASMADSHPEFACYLPGHYEAGMKLGVAVKA